MLLAASQLTGQVFIGPKAGVALSNYKLSSTDAEHFNSQLNPGFLAGVVFELPMSSTFSVQAEGLYAQKGASLTVNSNETNPAYMCIHEVLPYLEVPVFFKYRFPGRPLGGFISAGSELAFAFNGKRKIGTKEAEAKTIEVGSSSNDDYIKSDLGLLFGGGLSYEIGFGELILDARYIMGLKEMGRVVNDSVRSTYFGNGKTRSLQVSLGVIFPIGG